jgi:Protein of unknown function (DUF3306)
MSDGASGRLARWSQRKHRARQAARGSAAPTPRDDTPAPADTKTAPLPAIEETGPGAVPPTVQEPAAKADESVSSDSMPVLPSLDTLDANSDYTAFLAKDVPEALARAALRKLWLSDPVFANLDGLNDYDHDYNLVEQAVTAAQSSFKVGRGQRDDDTPEVAQDSVAQDNDSEAPHVAQDAGGDDSMREAASIASDNETASADAAVNLSQQDTANENADPSISKSSADNTKNSKT